MSTNLRVAITWLAVVGFMAGLGGCRGDKQAAQDDKKTVISNSGSDTMVNLAQAWAEAYEQVDPKKRITPPEEVHVEGGDVMPWNDYIFALSELEVLDASGKNVAEGVKVISLDSIEAPVRWRRTNLVDGIWPHAADPKAEAAQIKGHLAFWKGVQVKA